MSENTYESPDLIQGKKSKGGSRTPVEAKNTLKSNSTARVIDLLGEGVIGGLINGAESVFLDDTPIMASDGSFNFEGIRVSERTGTPFQSYVPGFPAAEQEVSVNTRVKNGAPVVRTVNNLEADAVRIKVNVPALYKQIKEGDRKGDMDPYQVSVAAEIKSSGGAWQRVTTRTISGKNTAPYQESIRVTLTGTGPWDIRLVRLSDDHDDESNIQDQTTFASYTEVTDVKLSYPDLAYIAIEVDAQQFGSQIPERTYEVSGMEIQVPTNYDPDTREYTGIWNGSFKPAVTDNPAWILYDLATNSRYGAGLPQVSKIDLYEIGKYCDELVPTGDGNYEPRFAINTVIASREDAFKILNMVASAARMKLHWSSNQLIPTQDKPTPATREFSNVNVVDGDFKYQGSAKKARHNVVNVTWNDPTDGYRQVVERVEDPIGLRDMDEVIEADITAFGCTSRGQARRQGLWKLYTERKETDVVEFGATLEAYDLQPNEVINIYDENKMAVRLSGRVVYSDVNEIELDKMPDLTQGSNWQFIVKMPDGGIETRDVLDNFGNVIRLATDLTDKPLTDAVWTLQGDNIKPTQYRVLKIVENEDFTFTITAQMHDPQKYQELENNVELEDDPYTFIPSGPIVGPLGLNIFSYTYLAGGTQHQAFNVSWTAPDDPRIVSYQVEHKKPQDYDYDFIGSVTKTSMDILDVIEGDHSVRVRSVTREGRTSAWSIVTSSIVSLLQPAPPTDVDTVIGNFNCRLRPISQQPLQEYEFWRSEAALTEAQIETNAVYLGNASIFNDDDLQPGTEYFYYIRGVNAYGVSAWFPVQITTKSDPGTIIDVISGQIRETHLYQTLNQRIDLIDGPANINGSVNARLAALETLSEQADTVLQQEIDSLSVTTDNNTIGVSGNANAISGLDVRVTSNEQGITSISQELTALQSSLTDVNGNPVVTANAFDLLQTRVSDTENELTSQAQKTTQLDSQLVNIEQGVTATSSALQSLSTDVTQIDQQLTTNTSDISTLQTTVNGQTASIEQKAELSTVTDLNDNVTDILAQYTVKVDVNGYVAGFGLMNDGNTSSFIVNAERFAISDPVTATATFPFIVQGGEVYISEGVFENASIGGAAIKDGTITNAKIGQVIESENYAPNQSGWQINKDGNVDINQLRARGIIEGSEIRGSTIVGSSIIGTAFLAPTELDDGNNTYVALNSTLNWSDTVSVHGWKWFEPVDIVSANNSDTDNYRRFRRQHVSGRIRVSSSQSSYEVFAIRVYLQDSAGNLELIMNTGTMHSYTPDPSGPNWSAFYSREEREVCTADCAGGVSCRTEGVGSALTLTFDNYSFTGDKKFVFRAFSYNYASTGTASMSAANDY